MHLEELPKAEGNEYIHGDEGTQNKNSAKNFVFYTDRIQMCTPNPNWHFT